MPNKSLREQRVEREKRSRTENLLQELRNKSVLKELCGNDLELYNALSQTMFLSPENLALYLGDLDSVKKYFEKCINLDPKFKRSSVFGYFLNRDNAMKALAIANQYYVRIKNHEVKS